MEKIEKHFQNIVETISHGIVELDMQGNIEFCNSSFNDMLGYGKEELKGVWIGDLAADDNEKEKLISHLGTISRTIHAGIGNEVKVAKKDGGIIDIHVDCDLKLDEMDNVIGSVIVVTDISMLKRAEEKLRESEEKYRDLVENINEVIYSLDVNGTVTYVSPIAELLYEFPQSEIIGKKFTEFIYSEDIPRIIEGFEKSLHDDHNPSEYRFVTKSGEIRWFRASEKTVFEDNMPIGLQGILTDVTERRRMEEELRESEAKYRNFVERADVAIIIVQESSIVYINPRGAGMLGYVPEEVIGTALMKYVHDDYVEDGTERYRKRMAGEELSAIYVAILKHKDGGKISVEMSGDVIIYEGKPADMIIGRDVTAEREAHAALIESEKRHRLLADNSSDIIWTMGLDGEFTYGSPSVETLTGFTPEEVIYNPIEYLVGEETGSIVRELVASIIPDMPKEEARTVRMEFKQQTKDGQMLYMEIDSTMAYDENGKFLGIQGSTRDITRRKIAEEALRKSEEKLAGIVGSIADHMSMIDEESNIVWVNDVAKRFFGQDLVGKKCFSIFHGFSKPCESCIVKETFADGKVHEHEAEVIGADGKKMVFWCTANVAAYHEDGRPSLVVEISRDITERKQAENALKYRTDFEDIITSIATEFINLSSAEIDKGINQALEKIGEFAGVDRSYIFLFSDDNRIMSNTYEWCADGIEPQIENLQDLQVHNFEWFVEKMKQPEVSYIPRVADLPPEAASEREGLQLQGIQSLIVVPMIFGNKLIGFLGMDSVVDEKSWPDDIVNLLKVTSEIFVNLLERKQKDDTLNMYENIVSSSSEQISFVDCNGVFQAVNNAFIEAFNRGRDEVVGHSIYEIFQEEPVKDTLKEYYDKCLAGMQVKFEIWIEYPAIGDRYVEVSMYPFIDKGDIVAGMILNLRDITKRVEIEKEILDISERERGRIGRDLHDGLGHYLLGIAIRSRILAQKLGERSMVEATDALEIEEFINKSIEKTRSLAKGLFPINLETIGLVNMINEMRDNILKIYNISFNIDIDNSVENNEMKIKRHLYSIIEEGVMNTVKHSGADTIDIALKNDGSYTILTVRDNGVGIPDLIHHCNGIGLSIMQYRARMIGSSLNISRIDAGGTEIVCRFRA